MRAALLALALASMFSACDSPPASADGGGCALLSSGECAMGCWALVGRPLDRDAGCVAEPATMLCMSRPEVMLGLDGCYEDADGVRWLAPTIPDFAEPGWTACEEDPGSPPGCE